MNSSVCLFVCVAIHENATAFTPSSRNLTDCFKARPLPLFLDPDPTQQVLSLSLSSSSVSNNRPPSLPPSSIRHTGFFEQANTSQSENSISARRRPSNVYLSVLDVACGQGFEDLRHALNPRAQNHLSILLLFLQLHPTTIVCPSCLFADPISSISSRFLMSSA